MRGEIRMREQLLQWREEELADRLGQWKLPAFRVRQIYRQSRNYVELADMTDLPKQLREELGQSCCVRCAGIYRKFVSADGTVKYLLELADGNLIECVLMRQSYGNTLCVSTQAGCRMGCKFCASGQGGLIRNLTAAEIFSEVLAVNADQGGTAEKRQITNLVLMGCGEPLDNYGEVIRFLRLVNESGGINISYRNISLSTCGLVPRIDDLAKEGIDLTLAISLHAAFDEKRRQIMPVANSYTVRQVIAAAKRYFESTHRRFIVEYSLIGGFNTLEEDADALRELLRGCACHINLIPLNEVEGSQLKGCTKEECRRFLAMLTERKLSATVRRRTGADVSGSCGQLRRRTLEEGR